MFFIQMLEPSSTRVCGDIQPIVSGHMCLLHFLAVQAFHENSDAVSQRDPDKKPE